MLRFRRYRVFLLFAVFFILLIVHLRKSSDWSYPAHDQDFDSPSKHNAHEYDHIGLSPAKTPPPVVQKESSKEPPLSTPAKSRAVKVESTPPIAVAAKSTAAKPVQTLPPNVVLPDRKPLPPTKVSGDDTEDDIHAVSPPGRQELPSFSAEAATTIHWEKQVEHFPVATESIIKLPTGAPVKIPRIQHSFNDETPDAKINREKRQAKVKEEFKRAWTGYKTKAWLHDELSPVSGKFRDPFCGWAATLVDTLDTLWIMGLQEEFEEAAKAVDLIDFTTSPRGDIPMFETTIRYLGGLLAAYDVSGAKYKSLLDKAVELAEVLIGAFDTPNRMPVLYYHWMPTFASQPHRASSRSSLAELGSLSMEFTRLAQLTKDPRYYDAIARVTNALSEWQDRGTQLNGVFPDNVDASGCNRTLPALPQLPVATHEPALSPATPAEAPIGYQPMTPDAVPEPVPVKSNPKDETSGPGTLEVQVAPGEASKARIVDWDESKELGNSKKKRDVEGELPALATKTTTSTDPITGLPVDIPAAKAAIGAGVGDWDCVAQGLEPYSSYGSDKFSMGGGQDSTYEYFPKQFLLLGGLDDTYRKMYIKTVDAVRKWMLYRPMIPDNRDILFSGSVITGGDPAQDLILTAEVEHLTCFIGGMIGMGAKIFGIDGDLEIAKKLADGCVWAYESTTSGIMPEGAIVLPCKSSEHCTWNETMYWEYLDPMGTQRDKNVAEYDVNKQKQDAAAEAAKIAEATSKEKAEQAVMNETPVLTDNSTAPSKDSDALKKDEPVSLQKRQSSPKDNVPKPITHNIADDVPVAKDATPKAQQTPAAATKAALTPAEKLYQEKSKEAEAELDNMVTTSGHQAERLLSMSPPAAAAAAGATAELLPDPMRPLTHKEYVKARITQEGLPPGFVAFKSKKYILRPEAIESVWYMYRITGDSTWQDKGWKMFESIINATSTEHGHSAIYDVTLAEPIQVDEMESFWLAETLKYFYLLYSTPDTISLDDWVLNTEAHPFKRPT